MQSKITSQLRQVLGPQVRAAPRAALFCWPSNDKVGAVIFSDVLV